MRQFLQARWADLSQDVDGLPAIVLACAAGVATQQPQANVRIGIAAILFCTAWWFVHRLRVERDRGKQAWIETARTCGQETRRADRLHAAIQEYSAGDRDIESLTGELFHGIEPLRAPASSSTIEAGS